MIVVDDMRAIVGEFCDLLRERFQRCVLVSVCYRIV